MPTVNSERLAIAERVRDHLALENVLSPIQARSFVRSMQTSWGVPTIRWYDGESQSQFEDARRLIHAAEIFREGDGPTSGKAMDCYRRAGELLEWLARAGDSIRTTFPADMLAAAAYQLGGLPAMANGLLAEVDSEAMGGRLYAGFLRADFDEVVRVASKFWSDHASMTVPGATRQLLAEEVNDQFSWFFAVELVRCIGLVSDSLRRGNNARLDRGLEKLGKLDRLAVRMVSEDTSIFVMLLHAVACGYRDASIYRPINRLAEIGPEHEGRLHRFARTQYCRGRGILWTSQQRGLERLLTESSFALCTPTGSGKTLVANLALVKELLLAEHEGVSPLGLYIVPSRALAGEVEAKLTAELGDDFLVTGLYGGADWGITDFWLNADRPTVLIVTVEKADALMRYVGPVLLGRLQLLIVDEAHQVVCEDSGHARAAFADHSSRSLRLETFVSRLLSQSPDIVRIALTAVAGGAAGPVARWVERSPNAEAVGIHYRSTRQVVGMLQSTPNRSGRVLLELMNDGPLYVRGRDEPVYMDLRTPAMPLLPAYMRNSVFRFNELNVLWTALHLLDRDRRILISVAQQPERTMRWFVEALDLPGWKDSASFEPPEDDDLAARFEETRQACIDYCGETSYELALLNRGIANNHGQMPQRLRRLMTELIESRVCPITVATATLTEGVNLPFDLIFLTSLKRRFYDHAQQELIATPLSTAEFRNLAGRAGRPGASQGMEGLTLIAVPQAPSATAAGTIPTQRRQVRDAKAEYENLIQRLTEEETDSGDITSPLSLLIRSLYEHAAHLLGITDEEAFLNWLEASLPNDISRDAGAGETSARARLADSVDELDGILLTAFEEMRRPDNGDLHGAESEAHLVRLWETTFASVVAVQEDWLERAFIRRGRAVVDTHYPDPDERTRLYQYGFTPHVGRRFEAISNEIRTELGNNRDYGAANPTERLSAFVRLGRLVEDDRGFGFRVRDTETDREILRNWQAVLSWWMQGPDAPEPMPNRLRSWQRFVAENLEFRLGVAIGAVVAQTWSVGTADPFETPSLATWRESTGLPWFGFWAKELLRWGTLDPFVAFALTQGLARTRDEASTRRPEFEDWMAGQIDNPDPEDFIDPQRFLDWQKSLPRDVRQRLERTPVNVDLTGTDGRQERYSVVAAEQGDAVMWIDPSGFSLAHSRQRPDWLRNGAHRDDFELRVKNGKAVVRQVFTAIGR